MKRYKLVLNYSVSKLSLCKFNDIIYTIHPTTNNVYIGIVKEVYVNKVILFVLNDRNIKYFVIKPSYYWKKITYRDIQHMKMDKNLYNRIEYGYEEFISRLH